MEDTVRTIYELEVLELECAYARNGHAAGRELTIRIKEMVFSIIWFGLLSGRFCVLDVGSIRQSR